MANLGFRLKNLRKSKRLSLKQLGVLASCSASYLSMVENGKVDPSCSHLLKIAECLGVTTVDLFQPHASQDQRVVTRKDEREQVEFPREKIKIEILLPSIANKQIDARLAVIRPGGSSNGDYKHPGEEFGLILKGRLELVIDEVVHNLMEGDSFYFQSTRIHSFQNPGNEETVVVWVNCPPFLA
jgi:transcriptional regulator with XRE-family HTH domain